MKKIEVALSFRLSRLNRGTGLDEVSRTLILEEGYELPQESKYTITFHHYNSHTSGQSRD